MHRISGAAADELLPDLLGGAQAVSSEACPRSSAHKRASQIVSRFPLNFEISCRFAQNSTKFDPNQPTWI